MYQARLTAVILTKNEEKNIKDCLEQLSFCAEIIILDEYSTDNTKNIMEKYKVKLVSFHNSNNFSNARNFALSQASYEWILFIDADERISEDLKNEIIEFLNKSHQYEGMFINRKDFIWGKELKYGESGNKKLIRLGKKNAGKWIGKVHEEWKISGNVGTFKNELIHYPHPTLSEFLMEINFYTDLRAKELFDKNMRVNYWDIIIYPFAKFVKNYIYLKGFKDGTLGFIHAGIMSFHSFLVRGKLYLLKYST